MSIKTLLVDDERALLEQAETFIENINDEIEVFTVSSAEKALEMMNENDYDLIVSDYQMPVMNGLEFLEEVREERNIDIPFIVFTGKGREEVAIKALNLGADRYIQKGGDPKSQYGVLADAIAQEHESRQSERRLRESKEELRESRKKYKKIFEETPLGVFHYDERSVITECNDKFVEIMGSSREKLIGLDMLDELENEKVVEEIRNSLEEGEGYYEGEYTSVTASETSALRGFFKGIQGDEGEIDSGIGLVEDITEKKEHEQNLKRKEIYLDYTPAYINVVDEEGEIKYHSYPSNETIGLDPSKFMGEEAIEFVHPDDREKTMEMFSKVLENPDEEFRTELRGEFEDGWRWLEVRAVNHLDDSEINGIIIIAQDISERKKIEKEIRYREKLERIITEVSTGLMNVQVEEIDEKIDQALKKIAEFAGADRSYFFQFYENLEKMDMTHEWCSEGVEPQKENMQNFFTDNIPWLMENVKKFENITVPKVSNLPPEAKAFKEILQNQNVKSLLVLPIISDNELEGLIGFDWVKKEEKWSEEVVDLLRIAGETIKSALDRKEVEKKLRESKNRLDLALEGAELGVWDWNVKTDEVKFNERWAEMLGHSLDEIDQNVDSWEERVHPDEIPRVREELEKHLEGNIDLYQTEHRMKTKSGDWVWVKAVGKVLERDENDEPERAIGIHEDITDRKRSEQKLKKREEKYRTIFESANDAIFIMKEDRYVDCNEEALELFECDREDIIGKPPYDFSPEKQLDGRNSEEKAKEKIELALSGEPQEFEWVHTTKDGEPFHTVVTLNRYMVDDERFVMAIVRDITEQKKKEEDLKKERKKFQEIFNKANDAIYLHGLTDEGMPRKFIEVNHTAVEMLGYSRDEFMDMTPEDIEVERSSDDLSDVLKELLEEGEMKFEMVHRAKDGAEIPVEIQSHIFEMEGERRVLSIARDITDRKKAEERIEKNKNKLERLHEISAELQTCQNEESVYSFAVEAAEDILEFDICGFDAVEGDMFVTKGISSGTPEDGHTERRVDEGGLDKKTYLNQESYLVNDLFADKDAKPVADEYRSAISVPVGEKAIFQAVSKETGHFDEEDLRLVELLASHVSEALQRIKVKEREEFLHSLLRHDVGNKAQITKGYLDLMEDANTLEEMEDYRGKAKNAVVEAQKIVEKIRKLRKIDEEKEVSDKDLSSVIDKFVSENRSQLQDKEIKIDVSKCSCTVKGGPLLEELFSNLIENAIQHSNCEEIEISSQIEEDECVVIVEDDGNGISNDQKEKIFEKGFKSGKNAGTGLGLYMVKEIAQSYDGSVEVKDSEMGGARFDVHLKRIKT